MGDRVRWDVRRKREPKGRYEIKKAERDKRRFWKVLKSFLTKADAEIYFAELHEKNDVEIHEQHYIDMI